MINKLDAKGNKSEKFWTTSSKSYLDKAGRGGSHMKKHKGGRKKTRRGRKGKKG